MKIRALTILISVLMIISIIPMTSYAEKITGTCGENLTWEIDTDSGILTISGEGDMNDYFPYEMEDIGKAAEWKPYRDQIKKIVVKSGVTSIGENAFARCGEMTEISLPAGIIKIGGRAFAECKSLEKFAFPDGVTEIGLSVFVNCISLKEMIIPGSIETVNTGFSTGCDALEKIIFDEGVKEIALNAFINCKSLISIELPNSIEKIENKAFAGCSALSTINAPDKMINIAGSAFENTKWLNDQPDGLIRIGKTAYRFKGLTTDRVYSIPEGVLCISEQCFSNCKDIKKVIIPASVVNIAPYAFDGSSSLEEISVDENNPYYVSENGIVFSKDMKTIVRYPEGKKADNYDIPESVETLSVGSFKGNNYIKFFTINNQSVKLIDVDAVKDCNTICLYCDANPLQYNIEIKYENTPHGDPGGDEPYSPVSPQKLYGYYFRDKLENLPFYYDDVKRDDWFHRGAIYCYYLGYMTGVATDEEGLFFVPDMTLTRAQMVQILARIAGADLDSIVLSGKFSDVAKNAWYAKAVEWAAENGVTAGTGKGEFSPDAPVTREQLAVFLKAMAVKLGYDTSTTSEIDKYSDNGSVSEWAVDAIKWAVGKGLITGMTETTISPKTTATRAQTAVIVMAFNS